MQHMSSVLSSAKESTASVHNLQFKGLHDKDSTNRVHILTLSLNCAACDVLAERPLRRRRKLYLFQWGFDLKMAARFSLSSLNYNTQSRSGEICIIEAALYFNVFSVLQIYLRSFSLHELKNLFYK